MLHRARRTIIFILLGAILNIAIAWGCVLRSCLNMAKAGIDIPGEVYEELPDNRQNIFVSSMTLTGIGVTQQRVDFNFAGDITLPGSGNLLIRTSCGLPAASLEGEVWNQESIRNALVIPTHWHNDPGTLTRVPNGTFLPLRPILPGFLMNTFFYALLLWLVVAFPLFIRRRLRLRRSHCPHCNYPFGASPTCTECGHDLARWIGRSI